jgi:hypothetical protein
MKFTLHIVDISMVQGCFLHNDFVIAWETLRISSFGETPWMIIQADSFFQKINALIQTICEVRRNLTP